MTPAQFRVLGILFLAAAINVGYNQQSVSDLKSFILAIGTANTNVSLTYLRHEAAWAAGAIVLVGLAAVADTVATWLALIILALVALRHGTQIASTITNAVNTATGTEKKVPEKSVPLQRDRRRA